MTGTETRHERETDDLRGRLRKAERERDAAIELYRSNSLHYSLYGREEGTAKVTAIVRKAAGLDPEPAKETP